MTHEHNNCHSGSRRHPFPIYLASGGDRFAYFCHYRWCLAVLDLQVPGIICNHSFVFHSFHSYDFENSLIFFKNFSYLFLFYVYECSVSMHVSAPSHTMPTGDGRGHWIPWNRRYRQMLLSEHWVLRMELRSLQGQPVLLRAEASLRHITPVLMCFILRHCYWWTVVS